MNLESRSELFQPGGAADHQAVVSLGHQLVHRALQVREHQAREDSSQLLYLEFLRFPDSDLKLCVVPKARSAQQCNLLLLGEVLGVLGVQDRVVNTLWQ